MKATWLIIAAGVLAIAIPPGWAQSRRSRATKEFMREKLELSQKILEGVTMEQWELVVGKGARLSAMTQEADWTAFENPKYDEQTRFFKLHVDSLVRAAKRKDVDAATLAYVRMTMSCVDCHKLVRGKIVASSR